MRVQKFKLLKELPGRKVGEILYFDNDEGIHKWEDEKPAYNYKPLNYPEFFEPFLDPPQVVDSEGNEVRVGDWCYYVEHGRKIIKEVEQGHLDSKNGRWEIGQSSKIRDAVHAGELMGLPNPLSERNTQLVNETHAHCDTILQLTEEVESLKKEIEIQTIAYNKSIERIYKVAEGVMPYHPVEAQLREAAAASGEIIRNRWFSISYTESKGLFVNPGFGFDAGLIIFATEVSAQAAIKKVGEDKIIAWLTGKEIEDKMKESAALVDKKVVELQSKKKPEKGEKYWAWSIRDNAPHSATWAGDGFDDYCFNSGNCHPTKDDCETWANAFSTSGLIRCGLTGMIRQARTDGETEYGTPLTNKEYLTYLETDGKNG